MKNDEKSVNSGQNIQHFWGIGYILEEILVKNDDPERKLDQVCEFLSDFAQLLVNKGVISIEEVQEILPKS